MAFFASMLEAYKKSRELRASGASEDAIQAEIDKAFRSEPDDDNPYNAYRCLDCRDTGWIKIWRPETVRAATRTTTPEELEAVKKASCVCRCRCYAGNGRPAKVPQFKSSSWHFAVEEDPDLEMASQYSEAVDWTAQFHALDET